MSQRSNNQLYASNPAAIRNEIQRFESVHPSIYSIYDLMDRLPEDQLHIEQQLREHVVRIEDSFVNSQEWTLSRSVPDLRLGILGTLSSCKSALVHRYLTGEYIQEESPEGGRFKKEVMIDNRSYLLLIRDEGQPPDKQFTLWVDAVIFVFSLENEHSFAELYNYYAAMSQHRSISDIPLILVGTQDAISESKPRVIDDSRARKLADDLKRSEYHETCATYGLNVEMVFHDACTRIIQSRIQMMSRPLNTSNQTSSNIIGVNSHASISRSSSEQNSRKTVNAQQRNRYFNNSSDAVLTVPPPPPVETIGVSGHIGGPPSNIHQQHCIPPQHLHLALQHVTQHVTPIQHHNSTAYHQHHGHSSSQQMEPPVTQAPVTPTTPLATPVAMRKKSIALHKSNSFSKKDDHKSKLGSGRPIPTKQGFLMKRSTKSLNKEWKKKYVILQPNGMLIYYANMNDYMSDSHGKDIDLRKTTVKIKGQRPKGSRISAGESIGFDPNRGMENISINSQECGLNNSFSPDNSHMDASDLASPKLSETPNSKSKKHKRAKSGNNKSNDGIHENDTDGYEFQIVSLENKQWQLEASSIEERSEWVEAIENQILKSLSCNESDKSRAAHNVPSAGTSLRTLPGNNYCADCGATDPDWASLNLGSLICIECCGIHRNLGVTLSRVRSLGLDEWPSSLVSVMMAIGNELSTRLWEANTKGRVKPSSSSNRDDKEVWIRAKYEAKEFIPPLPYVEVALTQQLIDAVARQDVYSALLVICYCCPDNVNQTYNDTDTRTALHIAAALGNDVLVQLLIWAGADVNLVDHEGYNALWYAEISRSNASIELLKSHGCTDISTMSRRMRVDSNNTNQHHHHQQHQQQQQHMQLSHTPTDQQQFHNLPASVI